MLAADALRQALVMSVTMSSNIPSAGGTYLVLEESGAEEASRLMLILPL
ncbi:MAG: hypothetical protein M3019_10205 [Candidatus Dormibacteraeota bacterium]|nr:hypothetical protein [Candidatus Dormibacteraeota bacterium]